MRISLPERGARAAPCSGSDCAAVVGPKLERHRSAATEKGGRWGPAVVAFGLLTLVAVAGGPDHRELVVAYGRAGVALVVGLVMAISAVTVPFAEQNARQSVPRQY